MKINLKIFKKSIRKIKISKPIDKKGFVIFQIDGLSKEALDKAMSRNLMPNLKKMLAIKGFRMDEYLTGVPSDTPFFQAGLLYGDNNNIPGFRWIEKQTGEEIIFKNPASAGHIEEILSKKHAGLLKGGSSYVNLFSGGASRATFTLSTFSIRYLFKKKVRNFDIFIIFIFHLVTFLKTIFYVFFEFLFELWEKFLDFVWARSARPEGLFPFARIMSNVIFKEIETFGAIMDISRGVPSVYLNYTGYDELSHHRGPYSMSALRALKPIDRKIKYIFNEIKKSRRKYDLFILSDHGHTPSLPFVHLNYDKKLENIISEFLTENKKSAQFSVYEFDTGYNASLKRLMIYVSDFFKKGACSSIYHKFFDIIEENITLKGKEEIYLNWGKEGKIIYIMNSGPMSNLYFSDKPFKMTIENIESFYPGLISKFTQIKHIGLIVGHNKNKEIVVFDKDSELFKPFDEVKIFDSRDLFFKNMLAKLETDEKKNILIGSIKDFCNFKNSGDLILFGNYDGKYIVNFENQFGAHGGAGGEQNIPFAVYSESIRFNFGEINNSCQIYDFLYNNYVA